MNTSRNTLHGHQDSWQRLCPVPAPGTTHPEAATAEGVAIEIDHVREPAEIMKYPVVGTPALVVDGEVKVAGRMPSKDELAGWLAAAALTRAADAGGGLCS